MSHVSITHNNPITIQKVLSMWQDCFSLKHPEIIAFSQTPLYFNGAYLNSVVWQDLHCEDGVRKLFICLLYLRLVYKIVENSC